MFKQVKFKSEKKIRGGLINLDSGDIVCGCCGCVIFSSEIYIEDSTNIDPEDKKYNFFKIIQNNSKEKCNYELLKIYRTWVDLTEEIIGDEF